MKAAPRRILNVCGARDQYGNRLFNALRSVSRVGCVADTVFVVGSVTARFDTLDLISHSATDDRLLILGNEPIDSRRQSFRSAFSPLASMLRARGVGAIRLLGCGTATRPAGKRTIHDLAALMDPIVVFGTTDVVGNHAFDRHGFRRRYESLLVSSSDLR